MRYVKRDSAYYLSTVVSPVLILDSVADLPWREVVQLRQGAGPEGGAWNPDFFLNYNIFFRI